MLKHTDSLTIDILNRAADNALVECEHAYAVLSIWINGIPNGEEPHEGGLVSVSGQLKIPVMKMLRIPDQILNDSDAILQMLNEVRMLGIIIYSGNDIVNVIYENQSSKFPPPGFQEEFNQPVTDERILSEEGVLIKSVDLIDRYYYVYINKLHA